MTLAPGQKRSTLRTRPPRSGRWPRRRSEHRHCCRRRRCDCRHRRLGPDTPKEEATMLRSPLTTWAPLSGDAMTRLWFPLSWTLAPMHGGRGRNQQRERRCPCRSRWRWPVRDRITLTATATLPLVERRLRAAAVVVADARVVAIDRHRDTRCSRGRSGAEQGSRPRLPARTEPVITVLHLLHVDVPFVWCFSSAETRWASVTLGWSVTRSP